MDAWSNPISQSQNFKIPAGGSIPYGFVGTYIQCLESSGKFRVAVGDDTTGALFEKGIGYVAPSNAQFEKFRLINESGADVDCVLAFGRGAITDNRLVVGSGLTLVGGSTATYGAVVVGVAATQIFAADASGTGWTIHHNGSANIFIGSDNAVTTASGLLIAPGEKFSWDNRSALWAISGTAGQNVRFLKGGA